MYDNRRLSIVGSMYLKTFWPRDGKAHNSSLAWLLYPAWDSRAVALLRALSQDFRRSSSAGKPYSRAALLKEDRISPGLILLCM